MSKLFRNILIALAASIGFVALVLSVLYFLGYDVPVVSDCKCLCKCKKGAAKSFGWGIAAGVVALLISLFIWLNNPEYVSTGGAIGISIASGYGIFAMIYCIVSGSYIGEVFVWAAGLSVKFPGIIFSFDLEFELVQSFYLNYLLKH